MTYKIFNYLIYFLSLIAFIFSLYLTKLSYSTSSSCSIFNGCDLVLKSKYSRIFDLPLSIFGMIYTLLIIFLFSLRKRKILLLISFSGTLVALILLGIQFFILKSICFYCTVTDTIFIIIFLLLLFCYKFEKGKLKF